MSGRQLAWGAKVSVEFAQRVLQTEVDFPDQICGDFLMACMAFETGETFSPSVKNPNSSATGLIQFMEATAEHYGTTCAALAQMTAEKQFDYVWLYFRDAIAAHGALTNLGDTYMAILDPSAIGKPDDYVLWSTGSGAYTANKGLDANGDGSITKAEACARVQSELAKGQENFSAIIPFPPTTVAPAPVQPTENTPMSLISSAFHFVFDNLFASAARSAASSVPAVATAGIAAVQATTMPSSGSANSSAGEASGIIGQLEDELNSVVANFVKAAVDQAPVVGAVASATGLDTQAANAAKAILVLGEQHALTYLSALFSAHHVAVDAVTVQASGANGAAPQAVAQVAA